MSEQQPSTSFPTTVDKPPPHAWGGDQGEGFDSGDQRNGGWGSAFTIRHLLLILFALFPALFALIFINAYGRQTPYADQWHVSMEIAVIAQDGTLTLSDILHPYNGHRYLGTHSFTAFASAVSQWDIRWESYSNWVFILLNFAISGWFLWQQQKRAFAWVLGIMGWLWFSTFQDPNLLVGFQSSWHHVILLPLVGIFALYNMRVGWLPFLIALGCCVLATFSFGNGLIAWAMVGVAAWLRGYRHPIYYAVLIAAAALSAYIYFQDSGIAYSSDQTQLDNESVIRTGTPLESIKFVLAFLGSPLAFDDYNIAIFLGLLGCLVFAANALYIWQYRERAYLGVWTALAGHSLGSAIIIMLSRLDPARPQVALLRRYTTASIPLWIAAAALIALVYFDLDQQKRERGWQKWLYYANQLSAVIIGFVIFWTLIYGLQMIAMRQDQSLDYWTEEPRYFREDACVLDYPLYRDAGCLEDYRVDGGFIPERILRLAAYRLTIFANQSSENVLPPTYQTGSPILVQTATQWLNIYIRDWMLHGISEADQLHIAPDGEIFSTDDLPNPLDRVMTAPDIAAIEEFIGDAEQVWYIGTPETAEAQAPLFDAMQSSGYAATLFPLQHGRYRQTNFTIYRFQRQPVDTATIYAFGDEPITLRHWTLYTGRGDSRVALEETTTPLTARPCEDIRLQSWWTSATVPQFNYSTTAILVAPDGNNRAQKDASIGDTLLQQWQPGNFYFDERVLTIPCDAAPGSYALRVGFYYQASDGFHNLTAADPAGNIVGERAFITELTIKNEE